MTITRYSLFFKKPLNDTSRGQVQFCDNLNVNLFENGISPCKQEFPEVQTERQILDHYLKIICNITLHYGIFTIDIASPKLNHKKQQIQTDDIDIEFSKVFTDYIKMYNTKIHKEQILCSQTMYPQLFIIIY